MKPKIRLIPFLVGALFLAACGGGDTTLDEQGSYFAPTAAVVCGAVNCEKIPESRINSRLASVVKDPTTANVFKGPQGTGNRLDAQREILGELIRQEVGLQMARTMNITTDQADIDARFESVKAGFDGDATFQDALEQEGLSEQELKGFLANESILARVRETVGRNARASDPEIEQYYQLNKSQFDEQVKVAHIVVCGNFNAEQRTCSVSPADQERANDIVSRA
ncbi:MAG: SurA N-terminal domain-containing protein, partial [Actinomycetota bacterium]